MNFQPVTRTRVADQVSTTIRDAIVANTYRPGDKLPSERDLADQFDVNRSSVREALHRLEAWNLIEIHHGGGAVVQDLLGGTGLNVLPWLIAPNGRTDTRMLTDLLQLRVGLLGFTAELAARNATDEDEAALAESISELEAAGSQTEIQQADYLFFEALTKATHNRALMLVVSAITPVYEENRDTFAALYPTEMDTLAHRSCTAAIANRDEDGAAGAMRTYALLGLIAVSETLEDSSKTPEAENS